MKRTTKPIAIDVFGRAIEETLHPESASEFMQYLASETQGDPADELLSYRAAIGA